LPIKHKVFRQQELCNSTRVFAQLRHNTAYANTLLWPPYVIGGALYFCPVISIFYLLSIFYLFSSLNLSGRRLDVYHTLTHGVALVRIECRSEMCYTRLAENTGRKKSRQKSPSGHHRKTLSGYIFATTAHRQSEKNLLSSNISSICRHNMVNFGLLAAEIVSLVWDTPANFNGFRVLAALLHGTLVVGISQTAAFNRGRHLYSAGRPSRWAFAHISSIVFVLFACSLFARVYRLLQLLFFPASADFYTLTSVNTYQILRTRSSNYQKLAPQTVLKMQVRAKTTPLHTGLQFRRLL